MAQLFEHREIGDRIADGDSSARFASFWLKDAKGKILYGKMRIRRNVDEGLEWHDRDAAPRRPDSAARSLPYNKLSVRKSSRGSSKLQLPKDLTNLRRYFRGLVSIFQSRHAKKSSVNENDRGSSSSSIVAA